MDKKTARIRRGRRTRYKIRELGAARLCVHRTPRHIYAQLIDPDGARVLAAASTLEAALRVDLKNGGNIEAAKAVGIEKVAFDRSGFKYHGRVKALADAAREHGLQL